MHMDYSSPMSTRKTLMVCIINLKFHAPHSRELLHDLISLLIDCLGDGNLGEEDGYVEPDEEARMFAQQGKLLLP